MAPDEYSIGAQTSKDRSRGECFEALAARRRSLFSADNKAARSTDGVPDSRARQAGLELIWGMFQCSVPSPPAVVSVARSKEPEAICFAVSGARNRRELAPGQHSAEVSPIETPSVRVAVFFGYTGAADEDDWPEAGQVVDPGRERRASWLAPSDYVLPESEEKTDGVLSYFVYPGTRKGAPAVPIRAGQDMKRHHPLSGCRLKSAHGMVMDFRRGQFRAQDQKSTKEGARPPQCIESYQSL